MKRSFKKLKTILWWAGGKHHMVNKLLPFVPEHTFYIEVFGGACSLLLSKEPSKSEVYNDIDSGLVNFFRVLRDEEKFEKFYQKINLTLYSREDYNFCRKTWEQCEDDIEKAVRWFIVARQSFGGKFGDSWGFAKTDITRNMIGSCSRYLSAIELLPEVSLRFRTVQIENLDFRKLIHKYDNKDAFFYCDPPYVLSSRKTKNIYCYEMSNQDHLDLIKILLQVKGKVMLSGYDNEIYKILEKEGWVKKEFSICCFLKGNTVSSYRYLDKDKRIECIWMNYNL